MSEPKEFQLSRLVGKAHEMRAIEAACTHARALRETVFAFRTPKGWRVSRLRPMGECIAAQPSGVVVRCEGPVI